jgi:hypothetical protein
MDSSEKALAMFVGAALWGASGWLLIQYAKQIWEWENRMPLLKTLNRESRPVTIRLAGAGLAIGAIVFALLGSLMLAGWL